MAKALFEAVERGGIQFKNRLVRSATWENVANPDGSIRQEGYEIYDELARGGVGGIITGFTSVDGNDYNFEGMMRFHDDALIEQYKKLVDLIRAQGTPCIAQLGLGAFYRELNNGQMQLVKPNAMTTEELQRLVSQFIDAAVRAQAASCDAIQIHIAHFFFFSRHG